jgi:S1-C subfamily serine protease
MAGPLGRVLVAGKDRGAGFALSPGLVVTASHVIRGHPDKLLIYVPDGGEAVSVTRVQIDAAHDTAVLWLDTDAGDYLATAPAICEGKWRVQSPPPGSNDPQRRFSMSSR